MHINQTITQNKNCKNTNTNSCCQQKNILWFESSDVDERIVNFEIVCQQKKKANSIKTPKPAQALNPCEGNKSHPPQQFCNDDINCSISRHMGQQLNSGSFCLPFLSLAPVIVAQQSCISGAKILNVHCTSEKHQVNVCLVSLLKVSMISGVSNCFSVAYQTSSGKANSV